MDEKMQNTFKLYRFDSACTLAEHKTPYCDKCVRSLSKWSSGSASGSPIYIMGRSRPYATKNSSAMVFKVLHFGVTIQTFPIQPKAKPSSTFSSHLLQTSSGEAF
ncbi:hypothetical protein GQX74_013505 [Glossina fuscipes]|nr:hypothetical protein GQX74_013505 [Glossina fuscipes]